MAERGEREVVLNESGMGVVNLGSVSMALSSLDAPLINALLVLQSLRE